MKSHASKACHGWRTLLLLAILPALTNCTRIDGSVGLSNQDGEPYSFEGANVKVFPLYRDTIIPGQNVPIGLGRVESADGTISLQVVTAGVDNEALYKVEVRCPSGDAEDACNVETPLHVVLSGNQLTAGGWQATALTEAAYQNITYYAAVEYPVPDITQALNSNAGALLKTPLGGTADYNDLLAWRPALSEDTRRPDLLANLSEQLAAGIGNNDLKLLARKWVRVSPLLANLFTGEQGSTRTIYYNDIAVVDGYAYLAGSRFQVVDIRDPAQPQLRGYTDEVSASGPLSIVGDRAYVPLNNVGAQIIDISDPQQPTVIGEIPFEGELRAVSGTRAYVATENALRVYDITHPQQPTPWGALGVQSPGKIAVNGDLVYLIGQEMLRVMNFSIPSYSYLEGTLEIENAWPSNNYGRESQIAFAAPYLYVTTYSGGLELTVIDVSNPRVPLIVGQLKVQGSSSSANDITISGRQVYLSSSTGLLVIDANDAAAPALIHKVAPFDASLFRGLAVADSRIYAPTSRLNLAIIDPAGTTPDVVQSAYLPIGVGDLAAGGQHAYMARGGDVHVLDLSEPLAPALLPFELEYIIGSITIDGDYAYLRDDQFGKVRLADISNPLQPVLLPVEIAPDPDEFFGVHEIALGNDVAVLPWGDRSGDVDRDGVRHGEMGCTNPTAGGVGGLFGVDISTPASASIISHICMPEEARAAAMGDTHAYAAIVGGLLQVVDYSNPTQPVMAGQATLSAMANTLTLIGNYVWASLGADGIDIIDVANPAAPTVIANIDTAGYAREVVVHADYAYVADGLAGMLIFDITDPAAPVLAATVDTRGNASDLFVTGDYVYAGTSEGIEMFRKMPAGL